MHQDQYRLLGENVARLRTDLMKEQLSTFRSQLEDFARKHKVCVRSLTKFFGQTFIFMSISMLRSFNFKYVLEPFLHD